MLISTYLRQTYIRLETSVTGMKKYGAFIVSRNKALIQKVTNFMVVSRWSGFHVQRNSSSTEAHWIFCNKSFLFGNNGTRPKVICKRCFYLQNRPGLHVVNWLLRFCQNWRILSSSLVMMVSSDERLNTCCSVSKDISKAPRSLICHNVCLHEDQKDRTPCTASSKVSLDRCWCICIRMW